MIPPEDGYFLEPLLENGADLSDILPDGTHPLRVQFVLFN
jgi:hypothetical protein